MKCPFCIKVCSKCGKILVAYSGNFAKQKRGKYGLKAECNACRKEINKQYRENNKEKIAEINKQYREDNKEKIAEYAKQYYASEQGQVVQFNARNKRRQREEEQGRGITVEQWKEMMEFFEWKCAYSGTPLNKDNRTIDHIFPLKIGGLNEPWNCVPMYANYNFSKQGKDMMVWYREQEFFSEERLNKIYEWIEYAKNKWNI